MTVLGAHDRLVPPMRIAPEDADWPPDDAAAAFAWLRREAPLYRHEPHDCWLLSRYDDVRAVSSDPRRFSSERGVLVEREVGSDRANPSILEMDPPRHTAYRRLVSAAFTPRAVRALEAHVVELARQTLDAADPAEVIDLVEHVAVPVPVLVIAEMLGLPTRDRGDFRRWSDAMIDAASGESDVVAAAQLMGYFQERIDERRRDPGDDLLSTLVTAEVDGDRLSDAEVQIFLLSLLVAGNETTRTLISGGAWALADHPDQRELLATDPGLMAGAVEELLRWVTPIKAFGRTATCDVEMHGQRVAAGDYVLLLYASANRDEQVFGPTAGRLDVTRPSDPAHVAFGFGEHYCLGAHLARLEARTVFTELLARFPTYRLEGDPVRLRSTLVNGVTHMPVRLAG